MALQFIIGNAGSGKSSYLYDHIIDEAAKNKDQTYLVFVPEQFTMSKQREFVARTENHCIMNIDVLSFERLAYRVFDELGICDLTVLEDIGKSLVIRKVAQENEEKLTLLKKNIGKPGYLDQIKSLLTEFSQYHLTVEKLKETTQRVSEGLLKYKLEDLTLLYQGMEEFMEERYVTAEKLLILLSEVTHRSKLLKNAVIAFDGYTGFTPVQMKFLRSLFPLVKQVYVTVLIDPQKDWMNKGVSHELFYLSKKYIQSVQRLAKETNTLIDEAVILSESEQRRFKGRPGLSHLEKNLFRSVYIRFQQEQEDVRLFSFDNPKEEIRYVAAKIHSYVEMGYRYQDMAIVTADMETYSECVREEFEKARIPFFIDEKKKITFHSFTEAIKGLLELVRNNFSYEAVFRFLKSGMSNLSQDEIAKLENYILEERIRGAKRYGLPFGMIPYGATQEELDEINEIRRKFVETVMPWYEAASKPQATVKDITTALYECVRGLSMETKLQERSERLVEQGLLQLAKQYEQIYGHVLNLWDKFVALMGDDVIPFGEYQELLEAGLDATKIASIPQGRDCVILGDIERTRLEHIKVLFFVGVNEGIVPRISTGSVCLSQTEREVLEELDIELAASPKERIFIQQFYLYMIMTKPDTALFLSYTDHNGKGELANPSYLVDIVKGLFPEIKLEKGEDVSFEDYNYGLSQGFDSVARFLYEVNEVEQVTEQEKELYTFFSQKEEYQSRIQELVDAKFHSLEEERLEEELVTKLYGETVKGNVSRLETYAECNMRHFLKYGLKLKVREIGEFTSMDMGNVFHGALEKYGVRLKKEGYTFASVPADIREAYAEQAVRDTISDNNLYSLYEDARGNYQIERLIRVVKRSCWAIGKQMESGGFAPIRFEQKFTLTKEQEPEMLTMKEHAMELVGKIDRLDVKEEEEELRYRVVDYKSGNNKIELEKIYDGSQLQLLTYENAANHLINKEYKDKNVVADGAFYYHIDDTMITGEKSMTDKEVEDKILQKLQLEGVGSLEEDDSTSNKSSNYSPQDLETLRKYTKKKIHDLGEEMISGRLINNPLKRGEDTSCTYCEFKIICGFDEKTVGCEYREATVGKPDEILNKMKQEEQ